MSMVFDVLGAVTNIFDIISNKLSDKKIQKEILFKEFYRTIFEDLIVVHEDYIRNLNLLKNEIEHERNHKDLLKLINNYKIKFSAIRKNILSFNEALGFTDKRKSSELEIGFVRSVHLYLTSYFGGRTGFTGLSHLIEQLEQRVNYCEGSVYNQLFDYRGKTSTYKQVLILEIKGCENWLDYQFGEIAIIYNRLKMELLLNQ